MEQKSEPPHIHPIGSAHEIRLSKELAGQFTSSLENASWVIREAMHEHGPSDRLLLITAGATLLASVANNRISVHVPVGMTVVMPRIDGEGIDGSPNAGRPLA